MVSHLNVVVAGGGVAGLEALLALHALAGERVKIELLSPDTEFVYRPLAVAEPFGAAPAGRIDVRSVVADVGADHRPDAIAAIDAEAHSIDTVGGDRIGYDALMIAIGARRRTALPGALTYRDQADNQAMATVLGDLDKGRADSVVFAVPALVRWALPLYELALMTATHIGERKVPARLHFVTHEGDPLGLFGRRVSDRVRGLLADAGIELHTSSAPAAVKSNGLALANGDFIPAARVVALPKLEVIGIPGLPQGPNGFIGTDREMRVEGLPRVFAAGDATWFPIKQGGIAAQQADAAAAAIARLAGAEIEPQPFRPVLRGALLTGAAPRYMRAPIGDRVVGSTLSGEVLWWPPSKIAGRYLAPYLAGMTEARASVPELEDIEPPIDERPGEVDADHREAVALAFAAAEADASWQDYGGALRWLEIAEQMGLALPSDWAEKRRRWRRSAQAAPSPD